MSSEVPLPDAVRRIDAALSRIENWPDDLLLRTSLNEAWFSNVLAWLLNPAGDHAVGVLFGELLLKRIGCIRTDHGEKYVRRGTNLKRGKKGPGAGSTGFSLRNATVLREYYLSKAVRPRTGRENRFCDVVLLDLDSADGLFVAIENKLFTSDRAGQLQEYHEAIDEKYSRAAVREFVYLTLCSDRPTYPHVDSHGREHWIPLAWTQDILDMLRSFPGSNASPDVNRLIQLTDWLRQVTDERQFRRQDRVAVKKALLWSATECLREELKRLDKPGGGKWVAENGETPRLRFSTRPSAYLELQLLPGLAVTVQGRERDGRATFDKIVVPFGAHPEQVMNLLDVAARDVYYKFFQSPSVHLSGARRLRASRTKMEEEHLPMFRFVHKYQHALKPMLLQSQLVRDSVGIVDEEAAEAQ